jgi:hypothetical protein
METMLFDCVCGRRVLIGREEGGKVGFAKAHLHVQRQNWSKALVLDQMAGRVAVRYHAV